LCLNYLLIGVLNGDGDFKWLILKFMMGQRGDCELYDGHGGGCELYERDI
jgi:hypothetical protein